MVHPLFFDMVEYVCARGGAAQDRDQRPLSDPRELRAPERARREGGAGEPRRRDPRATFNRMRVRGDSTAALDGVRNLRAAGVPIEINFSPTCFNVARDRRGGRPRLRARRLQLLHRPHDVHRQRRQGLAQARARPRSSTTSSSRRCTPKTEEYRGRMRVHFHEMGLLEELRYRLQHPAALLIVLPNGLVKLINALPFVCGDLRRSRSTEIWAQLPAGVAGSARRAVRRRPRADPGQDARRCTNGSISDRTPRTARWRGATSPLRTRCCAVVQPGALSLLPLRRAAALSARRRLGLRHRAARSMRAIFWSGLAGVVLAVIGVEAFNEYFDSRMGTDRVFNPADLPPMSDAVFWLGIAAFAGALAVGIYLTLSRRLADPCLRAARRRGRDLLRGAADPLGLSRPGRARSSRSSYGPWMVLGSLYLHTGALSWGALLGVAGAGFLDHGARGRQRDPRFPPGPAGRQAQPRRAARPPPRRRGSTSRSRRRGSRSCALGVAAGVFPARLPCRARWRCRCSCRARGARARRLRAPRALRPGDPQHRRLLPRRGRACSPPASCCAPGG